MIASKNIIMAKGKNKIMQYFKFLSCQFQLKDKVYSIYKQSTI